MRDAVADHKSCDRFFRSHRIPFFLTTVERDDDEPKYYLKFITILQQSQNPEILSHKPEPPYSSVGKIL
ncbi:MAG: hypothetical protein KAS59_05255 [Alphaproteobacteria bacterium]|nr:hypothetical protein [Alphaproteobacteria bacterium]